MIVVIDIVSGSAFSVIGILAAEKLAGGKLPDDVDLFADRGAQLRDQPLCIVRRCSSDLGTQITDTVIQAAGGHERTKYAGVPSCLRYGESGN